MRWGHPFTSWAARRLATSQGWSTRPGVTRVVTDKMRFALRAEVGVDVADLRARGNTPQAVDLRFIDLPSAAFDWAGVLGCLQAVSLAFLPEPALQLLRCLAHARTLRPLAVPRGAAPHKLNKPKDPAKDK